MALRAFTLALPLVLAWAPRGQDGTPGWPCWRGPDGSGVSRETGWVSEGADEPLWTVRVGRGHSTVVVSGGRLWTQGFDEAAGVDRVTCLDVASGAEVWRHEYPAELDANGHGGGTHSTPTLADGTLYCFERRGTARALDAATGEVLWRRDLRAEDDCVPTDYGFGAAPLVAGDLVVLNAARVVALERASGELRWVSEDFGAYYSTPALLRLGEREVLASFDRPGLDLLDLATGERLGHFPFVRGRVAVSAATPVVVDEARLFISSSYGHGAALVDVSGPEPASVWETRAMRNQLSTSVLLDGHLYGFDESTFKCLSLEGKERWRSRGLGMGALTASADGRLIVVSGNGDLVVMAADPKKARVLSERRVLNGSSFWAAPVLCDGRIYVRSGEGELACLDHRGEGGR